MDYIHRFCQTMTMLHIISLTRYKTRNSYLKKNLNNYFSDLLIDVSCFTAGQHPGDPGRYDHRALTVATLEQGDARRTRARLVLVVEQQVLVEREPTLLPLARIRAAFPQRPAERVLDAGLR